MYKVTHHNGKSTTAYQIQKSWGYSEIFDTKEDARAAIIARNDDKLFSEYREVEELKSKFALVFGKGHFFENEAVQAAFDAINELHCKDLPLTVDYADCDGNVVMSAEDDNLDYGDWQENIEEVEESVEA